MAQIPDKYTMADSYTTPEGYDISIRKDRFGRYFVTCWNRDGDWMWEVSGVVVEDDGVRQKRRPFTEEEALAEFNKWR